MGTQTSQHTLTTAQGNPLRLDAWIPGEPNGATVVVCHGFKGFREWGFFPWVGERLADAGIGAVTFDFSGNGIGDEPGEFTRLDLFEANTYGQELTDLEQVLAWVRTEAPDGVRSDRPLGLLGHSRAAVPTVVTAAERPDDIAALVTWAGVGQAVRYTERQLDQWEADGRLEFTNARTGQRMAVGWGFVAEAMRHADRYDLARRAEEMQAAHLILHGTSDLAVPVEEAERLRAGRDTGRRCRMVLLDGATHTLGAVHPFEGPTRHLEEAMGYTVGWFREYLA